MAEYLEAAGELELVAARGWLTAYEAASLRTGDIVLSATTAGTDGELLFNGEFLAAAAAAVSGPRRGGSAYFAAWVQGYERPRPYRPEPEAGPLLADLLPFRIVAARTPCSLADLALAGPGSLLRFPAPYVHPSAVELRIAGRTAARGRMIVRGEDFGVLIAEVLFASGRTAEPRLSGAVLASRQGGGFKDYDFRRPDAITAMAAKGLAVIHRRFLEGFKARCGGLEGFALTNVDQMTAAEWVAGLGADTGDRIAFLAEAGRRGRGYGLEDGDAPAVRVVEAPGHPEPLAAEDAAEIAAALAALRAPEKTGWAAALVPAGADLDPPGFFAALRSSWNLAVDLAFREPSRENLVLSPAAGRRTGLPYEMVATVRYAAPGGTRLDLCYSLGALNGLLRSLDRYGQSYAD